MYRGYVNDCCGATRLRLTTRKQVCIIGDKSQDDSLSEGDHKESFNKLLALPFFKKLSENIVDKLQEKYFRPYPDDFCNMLREQIPNILAKDERPRSIHKLDDLLFKEIYYAWQSQIWKRAGAPKELQRDIRRIIETEEYLHERLEKSPSKKQLMIATGFGEEKFNKIEAARRAFRNG